MRVSTWRCVCACAVPAHRCRTRATAARRATRARGSACAAASSPAPSPFGCAVVEAERRAAVVEVDPPLVDAQARSRRRRSSTGSGSRAVRRDRRRTGRSCRRSGPDPGAASTRARDRSASRRSRDPVVGEQRVAGDRHRVGITHVAVAVDERELHRLDEQVLAVGAVGAEVEAVGDAQRFQRGDALGRRRQLQRPRRPRTDARSGSTHAPVCAARSSAVMNEPCACSVAAIASPIAPW